MKNLRRAPADATAGFLGAILAILSTFDVPSKVGITADEMGTVLGALAVIAATIRGWIVARNADNTEG